MLDIEVVAIEGLDDAIIGTTVRNAREVLAYDYDKAIAIIMAKGHTEQYAEEYLAEVTSTEFDGAPAFVYLDNDQEHYGSSPTIGLTVH